MGLSIENSNAQNKEASAWGGALNQSFGVEGQGNLPNRFSMDPVQFGFDLSGPFGYLQTDIKGQNNSGNTGLVGLAAVDYGICGIGGTGLGSNDVIIATGPSAQQGVVNMRVTGASIQITLNAAGVAALAGKTVRFQWAEYLGNLSAPAVTLAVQDVLSPQLKTYSNLQQLLGYMAFIPYPNTLVCTISTLDGTVFPATTTLRRECRVITRPPKLDLPY